MSQPEIFRTPLSKETIRRLADEAFVDMVKFVVDLKRKIICAGGGLHSDEEQMLLEDGSAQTDVWGANYYLDNPPEDRWEYASMINVRPADGNSKQIITSHELRAEVRKLGEHFFEGKPL